jgi:hypothetical protein
MKTALLRLATTRSIGERRWKARLGKDSGEVTFFHATTREHPRFNGTWFLWSFHDHRDGRGGLEVHAHREKVRWMATALINRQEHDREVWGKPGEDLPARKMRAKRLTRSTKGMPREAEARP